MGARDDPLKYSSASLSVFLWDCIHKRWFDAALQVQQQVTSIDEIREVHVATLQTAVKIMAGDAEKWHPMNRETADHSMPYTTAVALMYGTVEPCHFEAEYWRNPRLLELVQKVKVHVSEEANRRAPEAMLSRVEVVTTSGARHVAEVAYHRGHFKNPMSDQEVEDKFRALASGLLTPEQTSSVLERLWHLEQVQDIGEVIRMVRI